MPNRVRILAMTYGRLTRYGQVQIWLTLVAWIATGVSLVAVDDPANPLRGGQLITWPNLIALFGLLISAGTVWQQWKDAQTRLQTLEAAMRTLKEEHLPETYVRQDLFEETMRRVLASGGAAHPPASGGRR